MKAIRLNRGPYRPDIPLFLILIPLISAYNYHLTYSNIKWGSFLLITFIIDTVQGYIAWWTVRYYIIRLDQKMPYDKNPLKRISWQIISSLLIGLSIISLLTEMVSLIARGKWVPIDFYTYDLLIISIWFFVINGIYIGLHYFKKIQELQSLPSETSKGLILKTGKQKHKLLFTQLAGLYVDGEYIVLCDFSGNKYYHDISLAKIEPQLPKTLFYRLNRQFIIHQQMIAGYQRAENGKLQVFLNPHKWLPASTKVSRTKAPTFKTWMETGL